MKLRIYAIILLAITSTIVRAQPAKLKELPPPSLPTPPALPGKPPKPPQPPSSPAEPAESLDKNFFAPELIMQHQKAIGLSPDQRTAIRGTAAGFSLRT